MKTLCLENHFLVAMPTLEEDLFHHAVVYLCAHGKEGAMGMVINHPISQISIAQVMEQMDITSKEEALWDESVLLGGPVQPERGLIIHSREKESWKTTMKSFSEVGITSSRDILIDIAQGEGPRNFLVVLGYAGWEPGQLEEELSKNYWLSVPADTHLLFQVPYEKRWEMASNSLGVNMQRIHGEAGHA